MESPEGNQRKELISDKFEISREKTLRISYIIVDTSEKIYEAIRQDSLYNEKIIYPGSLEICAPILKSLEFPSREENIDLIIEDLKKADYSEDKKPIETYDKLLKILNDLKINGFEVFHDKTSKGIFKKIFRFEKDHFEGSFKLMNQDSQNFVLSLNKTYLEKELWKINPNNIFLNWKEAVNLINLFAKIINSEEDLRINIIIEHLEYFSEILDVETIINNFLNKKYISEKEDFVETEYNENNEFFTKYLTLETLEKINEMLTELNLEIWKVLSEEKSQKKDSKLGKTLIVMKKTQESFLKNFNTLDLTKEKEEYCQIDLEVIKETKEIPQVGLGIIEEKEESTNFDKMKEILSERLKFDSEEIKKEFPELFNFCTQIERNDFQIIDIKNTKYFTALIQKGNLTCRISPRLSLSKKDLISIKINSLRKKLGLSEEFIKNMNGKTLSYEKALLAIKAVGKLLQKIRPFDDELDAFLEYLDLDQLQTQKAKELIITNNVIEDNNELLN